MNICKWMGISYYLKLTMFFDDLVQQIIDTGDIMGISSSVAVSTQNGNFEI